MTPIVCSGPRFISAGTYPRPRPIVSVISSLPFSERWAISRSGLRISSSAGASMSEAFTAPAPLFATWTSISGESPCRRQTRFLRLRMMSVTSSRTPVRVVNSCEMPSILTEVTAAPSSDESSTRRSELPNVWPKPRSSGSIWKTPRFSLISSWTIFGIWNSIRLVRVAKTVLSLLRVELDDELLLDRRVDLGALRPLEDLSGQPLVVGLKPGRDRGREVGRVADDLLRRRARLHRHDVVGLDLVARDVDAAPVHVKVAVADELAGLRARGGEAEPVDDVVETRLEHPQQILARDAGALRGLGVVGVEL